MAERVPWLPAPWVPADGPAPRTFTIELPPGTPILTGNSRLNRYERNRITQGLKNAVIVLARRDRIPPVGRCDITVEYATPPRRRKDRHPLAAEAITDADNIAPTAKACADGLTAAGVLPRGDASAHVRSVRCVLADETHPRGVVRVIIAETAGGAR